MSSSDRLDASAIEFFERFFGEGDCLMDLEGDCLMDLTGDSSAGESRLDDSCLRFFIDMLTCEGHGNGNECNFKCAYQFGNLLPLHRLFRLRLILGLFVIIELQPVSLQLIDDLRKDFLSMRIYSYACHTLLISFPYLPRYLSFFSATYRLNAVTVCDLFASSFLRSLSSCFSRIRS